MFTTLLMNKISQIANCFIQWGRTINYTNQNVPGIILIEDYQYVIDECGIIRFVD